MKHKISLPFIVLLLLFSGLSSCQKQLRPFQENNLYGYKTKNGKVEIPAKYLKASAFKDGFAQVVVSIQVQDSIWIDPMFESEGYWRHDTYQDYRIRFIDVKDSLLLGYFHEAKDFSEGLAAVRNLRNWGYINTKGEEAIPFKFTDVESFTNGTAIVFEEKENDAKTWVQHRIDSKGNYVEKGIRSFEKPSYLDSVQDWTTLLSSAEVYIQLMDFETSREYFHALSKRLDEIYKVDTISALKIATKYANLNAQAINDVKWREYHDKAREMYNTALNYNGLNKRRTLLVYIDYMLDMVYLRDLNQQKDMYRDMLIEAVEVIKISKTEDIQSYWDLQEQLDALDKK